MVEYVPIIGKVAEVVLKLAMVLGGNQSGIVALVMSMIALHAAWRAPVANQAL